MVFSRTTIFGKLDEFVWRVKLSVSAFIHASAFEPVIKLKSGAYIDLNTRKIVLPEDTHIHCKGNLKFSSDKHVVIQSGKNNEPGRHGYVHSIWLNPKEDRHGRPLLNEDYLKHVTKFDTKL